MPQEDRAKRHRKVEVAVAVHVPDVCSARAREVGGRDTLDPLRRVLAQGLRDRRNDAACPLEQARRATEVARLHSHGSASRNSVTTRSMSVAVIAGNIGSETAPA